MFLSKIELFGFKSFANRTVIRFNTKISAIVGPNGSGKTNIIDAVRWVLGEQRASLLRSEVMENVIFNGSATRKPLGMAEVSITFDNQNNIFPSHFSEVTITRRLFRNGESNYLLNNNQCRLKDINDILMDTGVGSNSYSIIELKMVESLLNGSLEERRRLLEEAAGITKFKVRRKETNKNLANVQNDLLRIYDIVNEIEAQVRSLSRQASKTQRYNKLQTKLKDLELTLWKVEFTRIEAEIQELESKLLQLNQKKVEFESQKLELQRERDVLNGELNELYERLEEVRSEENQVFNKLKDLERLISLQENNAKNFQDNIIRLRNESEETRKLIERTKETLSKLNDLKSKGIDEISEAERILEEKRNQFHLSGKDIEQSRLKIDESKKEIIELENKIKYLGLEISKNNARIIEIDKSCEQIDREQVRLKELLKNKEEEKERIRNQIAGIQGEIENLTEVVENLKQSLNEFEQETKERHNQLSNLKLELKEITTTLDFLNSILEVDESTRFLIKDSEWSKARNFSLLGEILRIDENLRIAYDSVLGEMKNLILVESESDIADAMELLKSNQKGKCYFLQLDKVLGEGQFTQTVKDGRIIGWASELANVEPRIRNALRIILKDTAIVKDFPTAVMLSAEYPNVKFVTLAGEILVGGVIQKRGSILQKEGISIGKQERIQRYSSQKRHLEKEIAELESLIKLKSFEREQIVRNLQQSESKLNRLNDELRKYNERLSKFELELRDTENKLEFNETKLGDLAREKENLLNTLSALESDKEDLERKVINLKELFGINYAKFQEEYFVFEQKSRELNELEKQIAVKNNDLSNLEREISRLQNNLVRFEKKFAELHAQILKLENDKARAIQLVDKFKIELSEVKNQYEELSNQVGLLSEQVEEKEQILEQVTNNLNEMNERIERIVDQIHQLELQKIRLSEGAQSIFSKSLENYGVNLNDYEIHSDGEINVDTLRYEIESVRKTLSNLGNINFLALQEYEEQSQRLNLYRTQIEDLTNSEKKLKEALSEINSTAEKRFLETFRKVNENFNNVFRELFGEGSFAELVVDYDNLLESDIEIRVRPQGKKIHSIETLSQGEKTLTAIAFLFAIYLVKPSPFCILDEVDAPLDDANVERFLKMIDKLASQIQFILLTHNRRTMEFADELFGVTMAEDGVSKVLNVKLVE